MRPPRADSFGVEVQHGEAVKMASSAWPGAVGGDSELDGGCGGQEFDLGLGLGFGAKWGGST